MATLKAYVLVTSKPGTSEDVVRAIKKVKGVVSVDSVYGRFDAVIIVESSEVKDLSELVYRVIEKNPNITHTETLITLT
ncbi:MAG: Lrp/AsnC ligand binding domain-containing protein [Candidatus Bathyarchaeia archaeon]